LLPVVLGIHGKESGKDSAFDRETESFQMYIGEV